MNCEAPVTSELRTRILLGKVGGVNWGAREGLTYGKST